MRSYLLNGKRVIDSKARDIGDLFDVECDVTNWQVTHLCINLSSQAIDILGYTRPRLFGRIVVDIPIETVQVVNDVISLKKSLEEIEAEVEQHP